MFGQYKYIFQLDTYASQRVETIIVACQKIKYGGWKTGSNYNFEIAGGFHEIPTLKPMFSGSQITIVSLILFDAEN